MGGKYHAASSTSYAYVLAYSGRGPYVISLLFIGQNKAYKLLNGISMASALLTTSVGNIARDRKTAYILSK